MVRSPQNYFDVSDIPRVDRILPNVNFTVREYNLRRCIRLSSSRRLLYGPLSRFFARLSLFDISDCGVKFEPFQHAIAMRRPDARLGLYPSAHEVR